MLENNGTILIKKDVLQQIEKGLVQKEQQQAKLEEIIRELSDKNKQLSASVSHLQEANSKLRLQLTEVEGRIDHYVESMEEVQAEKAIAGAKQNCSPDLVWWLQVNTPMDASINDLNV